MGKEPSGRERVPGRPVSGQTLLHRRLGGQGVGGIHRGHSDPGNKCAVTLERRRHGLVGQSAGFQMFGPLWRGSPFSRARQRRGNRRHLSEGPGTQDDTVYLAGHGDLIDPGAGNTWGRWGSSEALCGPVHRPGPPRPRPSAALAAVQLFGLAQRWPVPSCAAVFGPFSTTRTRESTLPHRRSSRGSMAVYALPGHSETSLGCSRPKVADQVR